MMCAQRVKVKFEDSMMLLPVEFPLRILKVLSNIEQPKLRLVTLDKMSSDAKFDMLLRAGVRDPFDQLVDGPVRGEQQLSPASVDAWVRMLRLSLKDKGNRVSVLESILVSKIAIVACRDEGTPLMRCSELEETHDMRLMHLIYAFENYEVLILPIYMSGHFTCMSIWRLRSTVGQCPCLLRSCQWVSVCALCPLVSAHVCAPSPSPSPPLPFSSLPSLSPLPSPICSSLPPALCEAR